MNNNKKAMIGQLLSILQWIALIALGIFIPKWGWVLPLIMFVIHSFEAISYGIPKGKVNGYSTLESLCLTWLYGFTWWKYLNDKQD